jgi:hypothetical protein
VSSSPLSPQSHLISASRLLAIIVLLLWVGIYCGNRSFYLINWKLKIGKSAIMAIYSSVPPPSQQVQVQSQAVEVEVWTLSALQSLSVSASARGTGVTLSIPLDSNDDKKATYKARVKEPIRRDSQKRREALLKGKEGSRRRQRWENGIPPSNLPISYHPPLIPIPASTPQPKLRDVRIQH